MSSLVKVLLSSAAVCLLSVAGIAAAQTPSQTSTPAANSVLGLGEIEARMSAQGITIKEIELRDLVAEVEGHDAAGRKIELLVDRRTGEILSRKHDD